jgi:spermidine synthase
MSQRPPYSSVFLLSASALAYEILLMRLFSVIQWHHFAYMVIGLALLGYGISGTIVSIHQQRLLRRFSGVYLSAIALFGLTAVAGFLVAQQIPFNAEEILWDRRQLWYLAALFLLLSIPFFFAATAICLAFMKYQQRVARIYAADLVGAGVGSLGVVVLLFLVFPDSALMIIGVLALIAALIAGWELQIRGWQFAGSGLALSIVVILVVGLNTELQLSPYKGLTQTLRISGVQVIDERSSPLGLISVVSSASIPFRHAPGLSLNAMQGPPEQLALFTDGDNMTVMTRDSENPEALKYLDYMTSALPYHLGTPGRVLVVGAGGGADVLQARSLGAGQIDAIEINPQTVELVNEAYADFTGKLFSQPGVSIHVAEVRDFLGNNSHQYDLIQLSLMDAFNASSSGLYALHESYLYTIEAIQLYLEHLQPGGYLALTRWINMPPRDTLKLFATVTAAMEQAGIEDVEQRLALIRGWQTSTLLIRNGAFTELELAAIREFARSRSFDLAWLPDMEADEANRFNRLASPVFYQAARAMLGEGRERFLQEYKFDLKPATDNRPYFHHFFKWDTFRELYQLRSQGGMPLMEWGYLILVTSLVIAVVFSIVLILLPLWFFERLPEKLPNQVRRSDVALYFFAIGLAFLFIEIAFMQKFILFLHHPIYSIAVTLTAFLVFAGLGSQWSERLGSGSGRRHVLKVSVLGIGLISLLYLILLGPLFAGLAAIPMLLKVALAIGLIAPLAFLMGMPFPLALSSLADHAQSYIPWAWGINGCASVISASMATLLAIQFGFDVVIAIAAMLYLATLKVFPAPGISK